MIENKCDNKQIIKQYMNIDSFQNKVGTVILYAFVVCQHFQKESKHNFDPSWFYNLLFRAFITFMHLKCGLSVQIILGVLKCVPELTFGICSVIRNATTFLFNVFFYLCLLFLIFLNSNSFLSLPSFVMSFSIHLILPLYFELPSKIV